MKKRKRSTWSHKTTVLYKLSIIDNLYIDIDCINVMKQKLFEISIDVVLPPPLEMVIKSFNTFTYNNILFKVLDNSSLPCNYPDRCRKCLDGYKYYKYDRVI